MFSRLTDVGRRSRLALLPVVVVFAPAHALAQAAVIHPRAIIDFGAPGHQVWGSWVAASPQHRLAVCTSGIPTHTSFQPDTPWLIRAQTSDETSTGWASLDVDPCPQGPGGWEWASVAYNRVSFVESGKPVADGFLIAANQNGGIRVSRYIPEVGFNCTSPCTGAPTGNWSPISGGTPGHEYRPTVVAGDPNEFYVVASHSLPGSYVSQMFYKRSTDGGCTWHGGVIQDAQGTPILSTYLTQATRASDDRLYIAHCGLFNAQFTKGEDSGDLVAFEQLLDASGQPLQVVWSYPIPYDVPVALPAGTSMQVIRVPYIVADPTDAGRLFLFYHDSEGADPSTPEYLDMNVYCITLRREAANGTWHIGPRVKINSGIDEPKLASDQWLPAGAVDRFGRLHVIFYDNSAHGQCGNPAPRTKYDVYYAISTDHGESFKNYNLRSCGEEVPLDLELAWQQNHDPLWTTHENNGIAVASTETETTVWATYTGVSSADPDAINTVIYASKITLANP